MSWARDTAGRWRARVPRRRESSRLRTGRGAAEVSVVVVTASLIAGVLFGNGLTRTSVDIADGLTWFADDPTGEVIQVNPATGRPEVRVKVGEKGDELSIEQWDGRMVVTNRSTGELTSWDLANILASGQRRVAPGSGSEVLHHDGDMFLVDRDRGTLAAVDEVSTDAIGEMWNAPAGIADAVVDRDGRIWALDSEGLLSELRWSPETDGGTFVVEDERRIDYAGARSVLVAHDRGVTVFGADAGIVVQVGTGHDVVADAAQLSGDLTAPAFAPAELVPVSSPQTGTVAIVGDQRVVEVGVTDIGCRKPATPEVFEGVVYVPCPGDGKVVRLTPDGARAGGDIAVAEDAVPDLVLDDGQLLINVPGDAHGAVVHSGGKVETIVRYDEDLPTVAAGGLSEIAPPAPEVVPQAAQQETAPPPPEPTTTEPSDEEQGEQENSDEDEVDDGSDACILGIACVGGGESEGPSDGPSSNGGHGNGNGGNGNNNGNGNNHGEDEGGEDEGGQQPATPEPMQAPSTVVATELPDGTVRVTWTHRGTPASSFQVEEVGGAIESTVTGGYRQTTVDVEPGPHRFVVTALASGQPPVSSTPSPEVVTTGRPGEVTGITGTATGNEVDTTALVQFSWEAAPDNGSPIVRYDIQVTDTVNGTFTLPPSTSTSASYTATCAATYCDPGPVRVTITPVNAKGTGPATTGTLAYDGPTAPPLPAAGKKVATAQNTSWNGLGYDGKGRTTLTLAPPPDWSGFQGTCTWVHRGNANGETKGTIPCDAKQLVLPVSHGWVKKNESPVRKHSIVFTASSSQGSVTSATYAWEFRQPVPNS
ncbi:fibronectin type III domain-containing protein [Nocardioides lianchengensis]|uniref:Fibronectin type-III domain-containing protein n=1 Tax=Nocardioides lianchengensis TaxID=1045774 RepID=A0A1G6NYZ0_9ACTN|nr:fibronectin type III domain-containing protein [Nocardioides lianchengensis]NYG10936.1 hypothetical protein [Nocardioides lianchengensis]SDC72871.1 hypothetical protein SAMN05421872_103421 [Nocardioides lianchengensis]